MNTNSPVTPRFSGSVPANYDKYQGPFFFEPYAIEVANRIDSSVVNVALEIACGTGRVTRQLRKVLSTNAKLIATDLSPDMMAIAKEKLSSENIEWQVVDAQQLPFADNSIDLVVCCFGYMFVPDKVKAFSESLRVLRPGGTFLFATWDKLELNGASHLQRSIIKEYLGDSLNELYNFPFSMNDPEIIERLLKQAGFTKMKIEVVEKESVSESAKETAHGLVIGGTLYNEIINRNPMWVDEIILRVEKELTEKYGASPMRAPMRALICEAWKYK
jgi:ubiquinone/menaquinone biosynthesis C-methylase UbiE